MTLTPLGLVRDHVLVGDTAYIGLAVDTGDDTVRLGGRVRVKAGDAVLIRTDPHTSPGTFRIRMYVIKPEEAPTSPVAMTSDPEPEVIIRTARKR